MKTVPDYRWPPERKRIWPDVVKTCCLLFAISAAFFLCALGSFFGIWWGAIGPLACAGIIALFLLRANYENWLRWVAITSLALTLLPLVLVEPAIVSYERRLHQRIAYQG